MPPYKPFLIAGLKTAKSIGLEPWQSPQDAFPTIENAFVNKGVLEKRGGFSPFATMKHGAVVQTATSIVGIKSYLDRGMPSLLVMDTTRANYYNAVDGTMTDVSSNLATPADIFTGSASDFFSFLNWRGVAYMVNNVNQVYQWTGLGSAVVPFNIQISSTDSKANHIDTCQYVFVIDDRMVLLGTVELGEWFPQRLRYGPVLQTDFTQAGGGTDDAETQQRISAAGMIGKTVYAFFEGVDGDGSKNGSLWRIRRTGDSDVPLEWERVTTTEGSPAPYSGIEFKDGLVAVGTSDILFTEGSLINPIQFLGGERVRDILTEFNNAKIRSVYGYKQKEIDQNHLLFTFADAAGTAMNRILDYNIPENNWTIHKSAQSFFVNVISGFNGQKVPTMVELDDVFTSDGDVVSNMTVDSRAVLGSPSPFTLIGCRNSQVYKWNDGEFDGTDDANGNINFNVLSARFNPFNKNGRKVACEKIGFFVDNDANASFLASVFKNTKSLSVIIGSDLNEYKCILTHTSSAATRPVTGSDFATFWEATGNTGAAETWVTSTIYSSPYRTKVISCDAADDTVDKFWVWIFCDGEVGDFHRIQISHTERNNSPKIHALMPFFAEAGRLDL